MPTARAKRSAARRVAAKKPAGPVATFFTCLLTLLMGALCISFGVAGPVGAVEGMGYALRDSGVRGTLVIDNCITSGSGKSQHTNCYGTFTSTDGRTVDQYASIDATPKVGSRLQVQEDPTTGDCYQVGLEHEAGWAAMFFAAPGVLLIGLLCLLGAYQTVRDLVVRRRPPADRPARVFGRDGRLLLPPERRPGTRRARVYRAYFRVMAACFGLAALSGVVAAFAAIAG